jgi:hypothetical protein
LIKLEVLTGILRIMHPSCSTKGFDLITLFLDDDSTRIYVMMHVCHLKVIDRYLCLCIEVYLYIAFNFFS